MPLTIINSGGSGGLKFINNNNSGGSTFFIATTGTPTPTPTPTITPTPTPTLAYRTILLGNPTSISNLDACGVSSGLTKFVSVSFAVTNGLLIYNDNTLLTRTYTSNPGNYSWLKDLTTGLTYSVTFDSGGAVDTVYSCPTPTPTPTITPTPTPTPSYYAFSLTAGGIDSNAACADSFGAITLFGSNISFQSNATFYSDYTLLSPYNGANLYYKNVSNNQYVQIGNSGNQTAAGTC